MSLFTSLAKEPAAKLLLIPGHIGIRGDEVEDSLARLGAGKPSIVLKPAV